MISTPRVAGSSPAGIANVRFPPLHNTPKRTITIASNPYRTGICFIIAHHFAPYRVLPFFQNSSPRAIPTVQVGRSHPVFLKTWKKLGHGGQGVGVCQSASNFQPAEAMKNGVEASVPLTGAVVARLKEIKALGLPG